MNPRPSSPATRKQLRARSSGFTLVELLVVIGIIAVLISILLPSLSRARKSANKIVCQSAIRQMLNGMQLYVLENKGYFPGPNTSGLALHTGSAFDGAAASPVQDWDWMSPTVGKMMKLAAADASTPNTTAALETVRLKKYIDILENKLRCPENETRYAKLYNGPALPMVGLPHILSYVTPSFFHLMPTGSLAKFIREDDGSTGYYLLPQGYVPKIQKIGPAANKIFVFEGGRYWNTTGNNAGYFDYTTNLATSSLTGSPQGNFHSRGPAIAGGSGEPYLYIAPYNVNNMRQARPGKGFQQASLRHLGKMEVGFFDGHVTEMTPAEAGNMDYWAPKGSFVGDNILAQQRDASFAYYAKLGANHPLP